jgi:hypothetical protein
MTKIEKRVEILQDLAADLGGNLQSIQALRAKAKQEIDNGGLTQQTCEDMAEMLAITEEIARKSYTGLLSVHQSMARFVPDGMNEGQKPWPP